MYCVQYDFPFILGPGTGDPESQIPYPTVGTDQQVCPDPLYTTAAVRN